MVCRSIGAISLCDPLLVFWESDIIELTFDISTKVSTALERKYSSKLRLYIFPTTAQEMMNESFDIYFQYKALSM